MVEMLNLLYGEVIVNWEAAKYSLLQNTPIFAVIDEPQFSMSVDKMSPFLLLLVGGFIGGMLAAFGIISWKIVKDAISVEKSLEDQGPEAAFE